jgi:hypothetical protein
MLNSTISNQDEALLYRTFSSSDGNKFRFDFGIEQPCLPYAGDPEYWIQLGYIAIGNSTIYWGASLVMSTFGNLGVKAWCHGWPNCTEVYLPLSYNLDTWMTVTLTFTQPATVAIDMYNSANGSTQTHPIAVSQSSADMPLLTTAIGLLPYVGRVYQCGAVYNNAVFQK